MGRFIDGANKLNEIRRIDPAARPSATQLGVPSNSGMGLAIDGSIHNLNRTLMERTTFSIGNTAEAKAKILALETEGFTFSIDSPPLSNLTAREAQIVIEGAIYEANNDTSGMTALSLRALKKASQKPGTPIKFGSTMGYGTDLGTAGSCVWAHRKGQDTDRGGKPAKKKQVRKDNSVSCGTCRKKIPFPGQLRTHLLAHERGTIGADGKRTGKMRKSISKSKTTSSSSSSNQPTRKRARYQDEDDDDDDEDDDDNEDDDED